MKVLVQTEAIMNMTRGEAENQPENNQHAGRGRFSALKLVDQPGQEVTLTIQACTIPAER